MEVNEFGVPIALEGVLFDVLHHHGFSGVSVAAKHLFLNAFDKYYKSFLKELAVQTHLRKHTVSSPLDVSICLNLHLITRSGMSKEMQRRIQKPCTARLEQVLNVAPEVDVPQEFRSSIETKTVGHLLGPLAVAQNRRSYVYSHLPSFPAAHTYMATPVYPTRPTSPRKIRELATQESRLAENALQRILGANKPPKIDSPRRELFEKTCIELGLEAKHFHIINWEVQKWDPSKSNIS
ncbi:transcription factor TFIID complex subunit 8 [Schizosaccharomyces japonicus yFS275]|uniref:Transcription initiation factor TFIID subunit 8 n=1 Tax=Schizosaccharomyces japonicus (strain yFS275 / FY16936) TaxID=402676 RepID=B6JWU7_SCHJY|nr:transcription factor TFIID complex subunit 8 [Schizosaccharomyces japonicus yFS275]EEB05848.2 transcription factor TFIID complex subunit 8 [Schizosaccharomyces japonicus yFS275]